jgi:hypothetical protein
MRRKKKARRGWRKKKRKPALASSIPGFVADHNRPSRVVCMSSMQAYLKYMVILILYATAIVLNNILENMGCFENFSHGKDMEYLNMSISTYSN